MAITGSNSVRNVSKRAIEALSEFHINSWTSRGNNQNKNLPKFFSHAHFETGSKEDQTMSSFWLNPWLLMAEKVTNFGLAHIQKGNQACEF